MRSRWSLSVKDDVVMAFLFDPRKRNSVKNRTSKCALLGFMFLPLCLSRQLRLKL